MIIEHEIIEEVNHPTRRYFRCWLDGSYNGEGHYQRNCEFLRENRDKPRRLRSFVIGEFCNFLSLENGYSPRTAQRKMVAEFTSEQLEQLNAQLIEDALDLVSDDLSEVVDQ